MGQLSLLATIIEPVHSGTPMQQLERNSHSATIEVRILQLTPNTGEQKTKTKQKILQKQKKKQPSILSMRGLVIKPNLCKDTEDCYWLLCVSLRWHLLTNRRLLKRNVMKQINQYLIL